MWELYIIRCSVWCLGGEGLEMGGHEVEPRAMGDEQEDVWSWKG